jgi:hypothetical protein
MAGATGVHDRERRFMTRRPAFMIHKALS